MHVTSLGKENRGKFMYDGKNEMQLYEYETVIIYDTQQGGFNKKQIDEAIKYHAENGWRLKFMLSNELGVNSARIGVLGVSSGTNSTIDQQLLVFERRLHNASHMEDNLIELDIAKTNIEKDFIPNIIKINSQNEKIELSLNIRSYNTISGIIADIILVNAFGEEIKLEKIHFYGFDANVKKWSVPVCVNNCTRDIMMSIRAFVIIRKYIMNGAIIEVDNEKLNVRDDKENTLIKDAVNDEEDNDLVQFDTLTKLYDYIEREEKFPVGADIRIKSKLYKIKKEAPQDNDLDSLKISYDVIRNYRKLCKKVMVGEFKFEEIDGNIKCPVCGRELHDIENHDYCFSCGFRWKI